MQKTNYETKKDFKQILGTAYQADARGIVLADFFEISEKAKEGGMGNVYFCRDKRDNKFYVLKTYPKPEDHEIFNREAFLTLKLDKHPYVVYSQTIVSDKDNLYIVMEYVGKQPYSLDEEIQGETLTRVMSKTKLEPTQSLIWAIQFCQGMEFLYKSGIKSHKDIKPDNILITPENNIKIADFGLSGLDKKGGTIGYRAPEYFKQDTELTIQSDIYSFGLVLYQMLNGGRVLPNDTIWEQNKKEYEHIQIGAITSLYCENIIKKCLSVTLEERYRNFTALKLDLVKELKRISPKYLFPQLSKEKMTANDYFLKGLGYYILHKEMLAFELFSKALLLDGKFIPAHYYRSKLPPFPNWLRYVLVLLILFVFGSYFIGIYSLLQGHIYWNYHLVFSYEIYLVCWGIGILWVLGDTFLKYGWNAGYRIQNLIRSILFLLFNMDYKYSYNSDSFYVGNNSSIHQK